jgi:chlorobactene glucosyltransferase
MQELSGILFGSVLVGFLWWVVIPLLGLCLVHGVVNMNVLRRLKPLSSSEKIERIQDVSVLVPARNEERNIRDCLSSLVAQQPQVKEIILLDDHSTDATAQIARELGFREGEGERLRLLSGSELPEGWVGKNWACHQLSEAANPSSAYLLFTDADTIHDPACLQSSVAHAREQRLDLLSLWPDQITGTWAEKLVIPLGYLLFMLFQPFLLLSWLQKHPERARRYGFTRERLASMGVANGQFMLFRHSAYRELGGHKALKNHLVEDLAFGRRVASRTEEGMRLANADGIELLRCRMYTGLSELWEGFSKNLRPAFEESSFGFFLFGALITSLFLLPFYLLPLGMIYRNVWEPACIAAGLVLIIRLLLTLRFRTSWLSLILHPVAMLMICLNALNSWRLCLGGGVSWKGRSYSGETRGSID